MAVGDEVIATDPETGMSGPEPVTTLHRHRDRELTELTLRITTAEADDASALWHTGEGDGERSTRGPTTTETFALQTTAHHPFWDATLDTWVDAGDLEPGHQLLIYPDSGASRPDQGTVTVTVAEVDNYTGDALMHDLTVASTHTYYVLAGNTPVLVHNCGDTYGHGGSTRYGPLDDLGRPTGVSSSIDSSMIGTGTPANPGIRPPGFTGGMPIGNQARGHLLGNQLGGSGDIPQNLVTLTHNPTNSPVMGGFENQIRAAVENGEVVQLSVTPIYNGANVIPRGIQMEAYGSNGFCLLVRIINR